MVSGAAASFLCSSSTASRVRMTTPSSGSVVTYFLYGFSFVLNSSLW